VGLASSFERSAHASGFVRKYFKPHRDTRISISRIVRELKASPPPAFSFRSMAYTHRGSRHASRARVRLKIRGLFVIQNITKRSLTRNYIIRRSSRHGRDERGARMSSGDEIMTKVSERRLEINALLRDALIAITSCTN